MRADAQRNRDLLLDAAVNIVLEVGGEPSRDAVAQRAQVGIATLYRHFPDRQSLLHATALHVLDQSIAAGQAALAESDSAFEALRRYMHEAVDVGLGALNIIHPMLDSPHWPDQRSRADAMLRKMLSRAKREGILRRDTSNADVVFAIIRFCRPLAVGLPLADEQSIAHRHIDIYIDGLATLTKPA